MSQIEIKVPDIGDFKEVEVIELLVKVGDVVKPEQSLITVESDKASMEIPSSHAGIVKELKVKIGDKVAMGSLLLMLEPSDAAAEAAAPTLTPATPAATAPAKVAPAIVAAPVTPTPTTIAAPVVTAADGQRPHASPSVRKFGRELGVDLARVNGTGPKGRILLEDVQGFVKGVMAGSTVASAAAGAGTGMGMSLLPWPSLDFSKFGETSLEPLSRIKKISGPNLHRNWVMIPH
jgi:pyruvate dehydrogenase E2 component (dihydrolipoamide acetyltransferase)